jgi:hypothetical protein
MSIPISKAKAIREDLGVTHLVIFAIDYDGAQHVVTHGETEQHAAEAAKAGNQTILVAHCVEFDLCVQGSSRQQLAERIDRKVSGHLLLCDHLGVKPFSNVRRRQVAPNGA